MCVRILVNGVLLILILKIPEAEQLFLRSMLGWSNPGSVRRGSVAGPVPGSAPGTPVGSRRGSIAGPVPGSAPGTPVGSFRGPPGAAAPVAPVAPAINLAANGHLTAEMIAKRQRQMLSHPGAMHKGSGWKTAGKFNVPMGSQAYHLPQNNPGMRTVHNGYMTPLENKLLMNSDKVMRKYNKKYRRAEQRYDKMTAREASRHEVLTMDMRPTIGRMDKKLQTLVDRNKNNGYYMPREEQKRLTNSMVKLSEKLPGLKKQLKGYDDVLARRKEIHSNEFIRKQEKYAWEQNKKMKKLVGKYADEQLRVDPNTVPARYPRVFNERQQIGPNGAYVDGSMPRWVTQNQKQPAKGTTRAKDVHYPTKTTPYYNKNTKTFVEDWRTSKRKSGKKNKISKK